jgi:hypothetical protein
VKYNFGELDEVSLPYAVTIHKMAMEKKSTKKKTAPTTKNNNPKAKVDTSKPVASKVVAATAVGPGWHYKG